MSTQDTMAALRDAAAAVVEVWDQYEKKQAAKLTVQMRITELSDALDAAAAADAHELATVNDWGGQAPP